MRFKLDREPRTIEQLEREAIHLLYIDKIKKINQLRRKNKKYSETRAKSLETHAGSRTNANHKSDMAIQNNNSYIRTLLNDLKTIDEKYNINYYEDNNLMYTANKKHIDEFKGE